ncbi:MAG: OmpH family outer membrane protein [Thermoanaerobaculia bacterium]
MSSNGNTMKSGFRGIALAGVLLAVALLTGGTAASAQATKIAIIDVQRLVTDSVAGKGALARLKKLQEDKLAEGKAKSEEIDALRKRLNEGRLSLADDKIAELEKQLEEKITAARRFQEDAEKEFNKSRDSQFGDIEKRVFPVIEQFGRENGYSFIFNKFQSGLLFAGDGADVTDQIIQRFDASSAAPKGN